MRSKPYRNGAKGKFYLPMSLDTVLKLVMEMVSDGQPSPMEKKCTQTLETPEFELLHHSLSIWPRVSYVASLSFKFLTCKTGQRSLHPSTVSNKIKSLLNLALLSQLKNTPPTSCWPSAYTVPHSGQLRGQPKPRLAVPLTFKYAGVWKEKSDFCFQSFVWPGQGQFECSGGRRDTS